MYKNPQQDITSVQQFMDKDWVFDPKRIIVRLHIFFSYVKGKILAIVQLCVPDKPLFSGSMLRPSTWLGRHELEP